MIHYIKGKVEFKNDKIIVIEAAGIGYKIFCSPRTLEKISEGEELKIFTSLYAREDAVELYGFFAAGELGLFDILSEIQGIGPKTAMMLASLGSLEKLKEIMEKGRLPSEVKGIGQKKTQKILLELTGKIKEIKTPEADLADGVLDALVSLGFPKQKARGVLDKIPPELSREEKIKKAIKLLGQT